MGRNTQGVRLMNLDVGDTLVAVKRIPKIDGAPGSDVVEEETSAEAEMERSAMTETEPQS